jgi:D-beta-D-heptose 7-phosphate kinase/D-beta-D-heptose 1-phosphate adenosyltransferase
MKNLPENEAAASRIVVFGDVMLDRSLIGRAERISPEAPVPVVLIDRETETLGGAGNVAYNVRCLGHRVTLVSVCGADEAGRRVAELARQYDIDARLVTDSLRCTTSKSRVLAGGFQQILRLDRESAMPLSDAPTADFEAMLPAEIEEARCVVLSDYVKGCVTARLARGVIELANRRGIPLVVDSKRADLRIFRGADVTTPNLQEAAHALGAGTIGDSDEEAGIAAGRLRRETGIAAVLVTRGACGMTLSTQETTVHLKALARNVYDVTGAGDTVAATLAAMLAEGHSLLDAAEWANAAGSLVVSKAGTQPVYRDELQRLHAGQHINSKILDWNQARQIVEDRKRRGQTIVFTNGCFDIVHAGHVRCLEEARRQGDFLVVGLNGDRSVRALKGSGRPVVPEHYRAQLLAAMEYVDAVVVFDEETPLALVQLLRPQVIVKGGDYRPEQVVGADSVLADGGRVVVVPMLAGLSTTRILQSGASLGGDRPAGSP